ncbi:type II secretion system protein [Comamonas composti]|uniref:type II secretion system protein n=1 Tax=Comamonas composti TaxID=408558 RepID=UPI00047E204F|nr:prepilin-type N-terminal cleavage/methylation domain-containing protein [Comamonas composti]
MVSQITSNAVAIRKQEGLTLIELLVTIVILSFTIALMSGALSQISQIVRVGADQSNGFLERWNQARSLYDITANMVIDPTLEKPFTGRSETITMVTTAPPEMPRGIPQQIRLDLKTTAGDTNLLLTPVGNSLAKEKILARFTEKVEFRFLDHLDQQHQIWPPMGMGDSRAMPSAILIRSSSGEQEVFKSAAYEGNWSPPGKSVNDFFFNTQ